MNALRLLEFFDKRRAVGAPLALATVFETRGSTYSKAGARMLIDADGIFRGMLSGGCLEGDLAIRAAAVLDSGRPQVATYDLADDDGGLWGLGVGCDGMIRVFLQPLLATRDYQPFAAIADILRGHARGVAVTVIESERDDIEPGASLVSGPEGAASFAVPAKWRARIEAIATNAAATRQTRLDDLGTGAARVLAAVIEPPPRILVLGAGPDAEPVVSFAAELGWRTTVADHRPGYLENGDFHAAEAVLAVRPESLAESVDLAGFDFAIVMSHHLASDRSYLAAIAATPIPYVGLLGPAGRRQRLLSELGARAEALEGRVHGPAGLDIGGRGPAAIALSIVAEIQSELGKRGSAASPEAVPRPARRSGNG